MNKTKKPVSKSDSRGVFPSNKPFILTDRGEAMVALASRRVKKQYPQHTKNLSTTKKESKNA